MGIFQPAGAGTQINVYDDADATGHAAGVPHTWAEINAAFPVDFALLQTAAGAMFNAARRQYYCNTILNFGDPGGGSNFTSIVDTNADIYSPAAGTFSRLGFTAATSASNTEMTLGTKIGTGPKMDGKNGCNIYAAGTLRFRCTLGLYGCYVNSIDAVQFNNSGATQQEIAGCKVQATVYIIGNADSGPLTAWNSSFTSTTGLSVISTINISDSSGVIVSCTAPGAFVASNSPNRKLRGLVFSGAVIDADLKPGSSGADWEATNITWSDTPGKPRIAFGGVQSVNDGTVDYRTFDTKVVDPNGASLPGVPVYISSDVDGPILDDTTDADGNVVFTWNPTGQTNVLPVREYYMSGGALTVRDRIYTVTYNGYLSQFFTPLPGYATVQQTFEWAGRDRLGTGYQADGGSFQKILDVVTLPYGTPTPLGATGWIERLVPTIIP